MNCAEIVASINRAALSPHKWVVIVYPDGGEFQSTFQSLAGSVFPNGSSFSGKTALLPDGKKISLLPVSASPPIEPFAVMFSGWADDIVADNKRMSVWRNVAVQIL